MKVSYSNYPILKKLNNGSLGNIPVFEGDKNFFDMFLNFYVTYWKLNIQNFNQEINVVSNPFIESSIKANKKLMDLYGDIVMNDTSDLDVNGCYLIKDFVYMIHYSVKKGSQDSEVFFYIFDKIGIPIALLIDSAKHKVYQFTWISSSFQDKIQKEEIINYVSSELIKIIMVKMFKTYAEVETKVILANSKLKETNCKYVNETDLKLTYLDSKWFTNLVKTDGFSVRGHFRLQPKKSNGEWTKEIIWINDFDKKGYFSKAKINYHEHNSISQNKYSLPKAEE